MASADVTVRAAVPGDLAAVAGVYAHYVASGVATFDETPPEPAFWQRKWDDLAARGLPFLVAEAGGRVVGYAHAGPWRPKPAYLHTVEDTVYLAPDQVGRGLGRALLGALLHECERAGVRQVIAVVADTGDPASTALHRRLGFSQAGRLAAVGYKHGRWVDTVLLQLTLPAGGAG